MTTCRICTRELQAPSTGRPPRFCSGECRRAAEHEIRRLGRRLERFENLEADLRIERQAGDKSYPGLDKVLGRKILAYEQEIARLRERLLELVADDAEPKTATVA